MKKNTFSRRQFLGGGSLVGAAFALSASERTMHAATPSQTEGPFYPIIDQEDKDVDLTRIGNSEQLAEGEIITVEGFVVDRSNKPIPNAKVYVWQANAAGRYAHERDSNPAPLDPNFQGWAITQTDTQGRYHFKTIKPGAYPVSQDWTRPPHIHFKVSCRGYEEITTQMYFADEPLNEVDALLNKLSKDQRKSLIATQMSIETSFQFNVVLAKT